MWWASRREVVWVGGSVVRAAKAKLSHRASDFSTFLLVGNITFLPWG